MASCPKLFEISSARQAMAVGTVNLVELHPRLSSHGSPAVEALFNYKSELQCCNPPSHI